MAQDRGCERVALAGVVQASLLTFTETASVTRSREGWWLGWVYDA